MDMDVEASARVDRLVEWCLKRQLALTDDRQRVSPTRFAELAARKEIGGRQSYWMGIFAKAGRSFGAKKARIIEAKLQMPRFYLDGEAIGPKSKGVVSKLTDLSELEMELVLLFKGLSHEHKDKLMALASKLHGIEQHQS